MNEDVVRVTLYLTADMIKELQIEFDRACLAQGRHTIIPQSLLDLASIVLDAINAERAKYEPQKVEGFWGQAIKEEKRMRKGIERIDETIEI